ncbi:hypothetical protein [Nostoc sp.]|uniref:hypothetical protein n=1 Tax=Nostoc sp. TaxID=1180 RepID=UPI002FF4DFD1
MALGKKADIAVNTMIGDALRINDYQQRFFVNCARRLRKYAGAIVGTIQNNALVENVELKF